MFKKKQPPANPQGAWRFMPYGQGVRHHGAGRQHEIILHLRGDLSDLGPASTLLARERERLEADFRASEEHQRLASLRQRLDDAQAALEGHRQFNAKTEAGFLADDPDGDYAASLTVNDHEEASHQRAIELLEGAIREAREAAHAKWRTLATEANQSIGRSAMEAKAKAAEKLLPALQEALTQYALASIPFERANIELRGALAVPPSSLGPCPAPPKLPKPAPAGA
jgi:hypothetical protein